MASAPSPSFPSRMWRAPATARADRCGRSWYPWAGCLLLATPLAGLSVWVHYRGYAYPELALIEHRAALVKAGGASLAGLRYAYPPLPTMLTVLLPGGALSLSIVTCLCSAIILGYTAMRLLRRVSWLTTIALMLPISVVPAMWYAESEYFAPVAALAFLAIALGGFVRFTAHGQTEGGFVAGIALALSAGCDPGALMYALVMCAFAPMIGHARYQGRHSVAAISVVLCFPITAAAAGWLFLIWKFSGSFPGSLAYEAGAHLLGFPSGITGTLIAALRSVAVDILHVPLYFAAAAMLCYRRRVAVVGLLLPIAALTAALWLGFAYSEIAAYLMLTILALVTISDTASRRFELALAATGLGQLAIALAWPLSSAYFSGWLRLVT